MNVDPPKSFDPDEALACVSEPEQERYGLSDRVFFYAVVSCRAIAGFSEPSFIIDPCYGPQALVKSGCQIEFVIKSHVFWVDVSPTRVKLWTSLADDADALRSRYLVQEGDSGDPKAWENLLIEIGHVERFGVFLNHADTLRRQWTEFLAEQERRRGERGF